MIYTIAEQQDHIKVLEKMVQERDEELKKQASVHNRRSGQMKKQLAAVVKFAYKMFKECNKYRKEKREPQIVWPGFDTNFKKRAGAQKALRLFNRCTESEAGAKG